MSLSDVIIIFGVAFIIGALGGKLVKWLEGDDDAS